MSNNEEIKEALELVEDVLHKRIAALLVSGCSVNAIAKELGVNRNRVAKAMQTEEFKAYLKELSEQSVELALNTWRASMQKLIPEAIDVIRVGLKRNNLEAVKIVMKSIGAEKQQEQVQSGSVTVVLPDLTQPKDIEVEVK